MTTTTLSIAGSGSRKQPDYIIGPSGIPRLVGVANRRVSRPVALDSKSNMNRNSAMPIGTDPVKLNKCLYNLTVRDRGSNDARSNSKTESDIVIRNQYSNKSNSSNSGSDKYNNSNSTGSMSSSTGLASASSSSIGLNHNRRNSVASAHSSSPSYSSSFIPRSSNFNHNLGNCNRIDSVMTHGRPHSTLLCSRQRRNVNEMAVSSSRFDGVGIIRQCRFTVAARKTSTSAADNRLNYQRKYDRTIFGYNQMEKFVLPPLQI